MNREDVERELRELCAAGRHKEATHLALTTYGPEILGLLMVLAGNEADACDAFSAFCEDFWAGISRFEWRSSLRTWSYTVARNAFYTQASNPKRAAGRNVPLSEAPEVAALAVQVRTDTLPHLRTELKQKVQALRESLTPDDRLLLTLRIDQGLSYEEIARVTLGDGALDAEVLARENQRLRQRLTVVKKSLKEKARAAGIRE